jgi:hypothetical protein
MGMGLQNLAIFLPDDRAVASVVGSELRFRQFASFYAQIAQPLTLLRKIEMRYSGPETANWSAGFGWLVAEAYGSQRQKVRVHFDIEPRPSLASRRWTGWAQHALIDEVVDRFVESCRGSEKALL